MDLLDQLCQMAGCTYLSDLPGMMKTEQFQRCICQIPPDRYPLLEWVDAYQYLTGRDSCGYETVEQVQRSLSKMAMTGGSER